MAAMCITCFLCICVKGFLWLTDASGRLMDASRQYLHRRRTDVATAAPKEAKADIPPSRGTRRRREIKRRRDTEKASRHMLRLRRTWHNMNDKIHAKHGPMVGMLCRPTTHHFTCGAIRFGCYSLCLLVPALATQELAVETDTMVAVLTVLHLLGVFRRLEGCLRASPVRGLVHRFSRFWSQTVYRKFTEAAAVGRRTERVTVPRQVPPRRNTLDEQMQAEERRWRQLQPGRRRSRHGRGGRRKETNQSACNVWVRTQLYTRACEVFVAETTLEAAMDGATYVERIPKAAESMISPIAGCPQGMEVAYDETTDLQCDPGPGERGWERHVAFLGHGSRPRVTATGHGHGPRPRVTNRASASGHGPRSIRGVEFRRDTHGANVGRRQESVVIQR